jgi:CRP-like cAMP-binding protein
MSKIVEALSRYPLFALFDRRWLTEWAASAERLPVAVGETLCQAGTPGEHAYVVAEGRARVSRVKSQREAVLGCFGPGDLFGEYALLSPGLNTATCRAAGSGAVYRLPLRPVRQVLASWPEVQERLKRWLLLHGAVNYVRGGPLLGFISATALVPLLECLAADEFAANRAIQADGLNADRWFVIRSGQARASPSGEGGEPVLLGPGACFGEQALLARGELALVESLTDVQCLTLRREAFQGDRPTHGPPEQQTHQSFLPRHLKAQPWVGQQEANDCGVAALAMVARCHGKVVELEALRRSVPVGPSGASLHDLAEAAHRLGLASRALRIEASHLNDVGLPAIAHLTEGHYVVLYALAGDEVLLGDPAVGVVPVKLARFRERWGGHLLLVTPSAEPATS